jgi:predicted transcriptional regulator
LSEKLNGRKEIGEGMSVQGTPYGGFQSVGEIVVATNSLRFHPDQEGITVAVELLSNHISGAPVVNANGHFLGFISEFDILESLESGKDLNEIKAKDIMNSSQISVEDSTSLTEAARIMKNRHLLVLPVVKNGVVVKSITRHDLLRAKVGLGPGVEE